MSRNEVNSSSALYPARKEHSHLWSTSVEPGFLLTPLEPPEKKDSLDDGMDVKIDFGIWLAEPYDSGDQDSAIQEAGHPSIHPLQSFQQPSEIGQSPLNGSSEVSKIPSDRSPPSDLVAPRYTPPDEAHRQAVLGLFADIMDDAAATAAQEYKYLDLGPLAGSEIMQERIEMQQMRQEEQKASYAQQSHLTSAGFVLTDFDVIAAIEKMQAGMDVQQIFHGTVWALDNPTHAERHRQYREAVASLRYARSDCDLPESETLGTGYQNFDFDPRYQTLSRSGHQHSGMDSQYQGSSSTEYQHSGIDSRYQTPSGAEYQHPDIDTHYQTPSDAGYQHYGMGTQYQTPSGSPSYDPPAAYNSTPDVECMLSDRNSTWEEPDEYSDQDSPTLRKQRRREATTHLVNGARPDQGETSIQQHTGTSHSSSYQSSPPVTVPEAPEANYDGKYDFSKREISDMCNGYVSQHYYSPSAESAIIMPRFEQPPESLKDWLDHKISKRKEGDATDGFNSPQILRYDPLGDLNPQNEKHEAARCLLATELIFDQDVTGQSDCYDHGMASAYHFIPKSQTDKWNDDSNFFITDTEFEELVEALDKKKENCGQLPNKNDHQVVEVDEMEYEFAAPNLGQPAEENRGELLKNNTQQVADDVEMELDLTTPSPDQPAKETEYCSKEDVRQDQLLADQAFKRLEPSMIQGRVPEQVLPSSPESSAEPRMVPKPDHPVTPTGERQRKVVRLETTPTRSPMILDYTESPDSFKTAYGSPQVINLTSDSEFLPIQSFHTDRPSTPDRRASRSSKGRKIRHGSDKTTKNVFAAVEERRDQLEGQSSNALSTGSGNWGGTPPRPRPLEPSPLEGYGTGGPRYGAGDTIHSPGTPTPSGRRSSRLSSAFVAAQQIHHSFIPQTTAPKPLPTVGTFYPNPNPNAHGQQPQPFSGNKHYGSTTGSHHFDMWGNRIGRGEQFGFSQPENNGAPGQTSYPVANNPIQYHMQPPSQRHMEHHQLYTGNMHMHHGPTSPGNRSSDSTITAASQFNSSPGFPWQGYQPETPSKNEKMRRHMPSTDDPSPSPHSTPGLPGELSMNNPLSDPRTPRTFDSTPIKFDLWQLASKSAAREKAVITFRGHKECAKAQKILEEAATASLEKRIMFTETFDDKHTTITLSAPAGNNIRGWVKTLLPHARVEISMI